MKLYVKQLNKKNFLLTVILSLIFISIILFSEQNLVRKPESTDNISNIETNISSVSENEEVKIKYENMGILESVQEIETEHYIVSKIEFVKENCDVMITYPHIEIFGNKELSYKINKILYEETFPDDFTEEEMLDCQGAMYAQIENSIVYFDSNIISTHIKAEYGTNGVTGYHQGSTISLEDGERLTLDSFDITIENLCGAMNNSTVYMSQTVCGLKNTTDDITRYYEDGFSIINQVNNLNTNMHDNFFLENNSVYLIIDTIPFHAENTGYIKISHDWNLK